MKHKGGFFFPLQPVGKMRLAGATGLICLLSLWLVPETVSHSDSSVPTPRGSAIANKSMTPLQGQEAIDRLKQQGAYNSLQEAMAAARYEPQWQTAPKIQGLGPAYELKNAANGLLA